YNSEKAEITIRNLLEQKSGFTNSEKDYPSASEKMSLEEWAKTISRKELKSLPGTEYAYSNTNYNLLGLVIEKVTGKSYRDYMENEILKPLGLNNTFVDITDDKNIIEGSRLGYRHTFAYAIPVKKAAIPAGYFYSNTEDMARWMNIWMGEEEIPKDLSEALEITKSRLKEEGDYFSGWEYFSEDLIGHSGGTPNYSSRIVYSDKEKTAVCVLTNLNVASSTDSLCNILFEVIKEDNLQNSKGSQSEKEEMITQDVWTVFDIIFSIITLLGIIILLLALIIKNSKILIGLDSLLSLLLALMLILFPIIFGAGLKEILFIWAPISMVGGLAVMALDILLITFKILMVKKHARDYKAG
ncbi:MAG: beta-lactamase family protein, partial [Lachnospiraceae bacterium]|nr:beta-lactamase family protein [Lachnospiraceae bacterium]